MSWVTTRRKPRSQYSSIEEFERQQQVSAAAAELGDRTCRAATCKPQDDGLLRAWRLPAQLPHSFTCGQKTRTGSGKGRMTAMESGHRWRAGTTRQEPDGSSGLIGLGKRMPRQQADAAHPWAAEPTVHAEQAMKQAFSIPDASSKQVKLFSDLAGRATLLSFLPRDDKELHALALHPELAPEPLNKGHEALYQTSANVFFAPFGRWRLLGTTCLNAVSIGC